MGIPPGVPVTAAKVERTLPLVLSRGLSRHTTASTPSGACPGVPAAWLRAAALRSLGKYSLSETDVLRSANDANGADPAEPISPGERQLSVGLSRPPSPLLMSGCGASRSF